MNSSTGPTLGNSFLSESFLQSSLLGEVLQVLFALVLVGGVVAEILLSASVANQGFKKVANVIHDFVRKFRSTSVPRASFSHLTEIG